MGARPEETCGKSLGECIQWIQSCEAAFGGVEPLFAVLDPDGTVAYAARSVERTLGRSPGELLGEPLAEFVHPDDRATVVEAVRDVVDGGGDRHVVRIETAGGTWRRHDVSIRSLFEAFGVDGVAVAVREGDAAAVSALEVAPVGVTVSAGIGLDGPVTYANREALSLVRADADDLLGETVAGLFAATTELSELASSVTVGGPPVSTAELRLVDAGDEPSWWRVDVVPVERGGDGDATVVFYRDVTASRRDSKMLDALHETARKLLACNSKAEVPARTVDAVETLLSISFGLFLQYEPEQEQLVPISRSKSASELLDTVDSVPVGGGLLSEVFVSGWGRYLTDVADEPSLEFEAPLEAALLLPVGKHGLLFVGCPDDRLGPQQRDLARILADVVELALDRIDKLELSDVRGRKLRRQRAELAALARTEETIRAVNRALVRAGDREGIERAVCQGLAESETVVFTWFGSVDEFEDRVVPTSWAGVDETYLDKFAARYETHPIHGLAVAAVRSGCVVVADAVHGNADWDPVRSEVLRYGFQSVAAVPVGHHETVAGVLVVGDSRPAAFDDHLRDVYAELGDTVGAAMFRARLETDTDGSTSVLVRLQVDDEGCLLNRMSKRLGCTIELEDLSSFEKDTHLIILTVVGSSVDALTAFLGEQEVVESVRDLVTEGERTLLELSLRSHPVLDVLTEWGGTIESFEARDGTADLTIELPAGADVRAVVGAVQTVWPDTRFHSRRERTHSVETPTTFLARLRENLTDRQLQAIRTAHYGGFYDWPRTSRNDELASVMDITSSTFQYHRRVAERKLLELLFDSD